MILDTNAVESSLYMLKFSRTCLKYNSHPASFIIHKIDRQIIGRDSLIETKIGSIKSFSARESRITASKSLLQSFISNINDSQRVSVYRQCYSYDT